MPRSWKATLIYGYPLVSLPLVGLDNSVGGKVIGVGLVGGYELVESMVALLV